MAIQEKRQLFRLKDDIVVSYLDIHDDDVNPAIEQLTSPGAKKDFFPKLSVEQEPVESDISIFGLAFTSNKPMGKGSYITVTMKLDTVPLPLQSVCAVTHCECDTAERYYRVGVKFLYMHKDDFRILEDYIVQKLQSALNHWSDNTKDIDFLDAGQQ